MLHPQHLQKSLERLKNKDETGLYALAPRLIEEIISEVHRTLDSFFIPNDDPNEMLKHREKLHHEEGIREVTKKIAKQYGKTYRKIILQEARTHVQDDMGYIPKKLEYKDRNFWPKWQAQNETQCSWL